MQIRQGINQNLRSNISRLASLSPSMRRFNVPQQPSLHLIDRGQNERIQERSDRTTSNLPRFPDLKNVLEQHPEFQSFFKTLCKDESSLRLCKAAKQSARTSSTACRRTLPRRSCPHTQK